MTKIWKNFFRGRAVTGAAGLLVMWSVAVAPAAGGSWVEIGWAVFTATFAYGFVLPAIVYVIDKTR